MKKKFWKYSYQLSLPSFLFHKGYHHSGPEALTIIFEKFWFLCLRVAALTYVDAYTMLKVFL